MADMQALLNGFLDLLMKAFPTSHFADTIEKFSKLTCLGYINWFVPVSEMVAIGSAWLLAPGAPPPPPPPPRPPPPKEPSKSANI